MKWTVVNIGLYNNWTQVKHVSIHRTSVRGDEMNVCWSLFEDYGCLYCSSVLLSFFRPFPHGDSLSYIVFLKPSWPYACWLSKPLLEYLWPYACWLSKPLLEYLSHRIPLSNLLWVVVAKAALFIGPLHINAARKVVATHWMQQQQPPFEHLTFPSFLRVCGTHPCY